MCEILSNSCTCRVLCISAELSRKSICLCSQLCQCFYIHIWQSRCMPRKPLATLSTAGPRTGCLSPPPIPIPLQKVLYVDANDMSSRLHLGMLHVLCAQTEHVALVEYFPLLWLCGRTALRSQLQEGWSCHKGWSRSAQVFGSDHCQSPPWWRNWWRWSWRPTGYDIQDRHAWSWPLLLLFHRT